MERFLERLAALPVIARVGILAGILVFLGGAYYTLLYSEMEDEQKQFIRDIERFKEEKKGYETRKRQYLAYRNEVNALLEEQKDLLRILPKRDDIEQFIESINAQVEVAGLSRVASIRDSAVAEEMYLRIPIRVSLVGSYHQINRFFKNVGELRRIVTIADLQLKRVEAPLTANLQERSQLRADFVAQTFQFIEGPIATLPKKATAPGAHK